jgi:hypothetical protein
MYDPKKSSSVYAKGGLDIALPPFADVVVEGGGVTVAASSSSPSLLAHEDEEDDGDSDAGAAGPSAKTLAGWMSFG